MSVAMDVEDEVRSDDEVFGDDEALGDDALGEDEVRTSILPAPTFPAAMVVDYQDGGGGDLTPYGGGSRAEAPDNKKPFLLVRLGHKLCGFNR